MKTSRKRSYHEHTDLQKRLASYTTAAGAVGIAGLAVVPGAQANVIYTDITDVVLKQTNSASPQTYDLNLNGDFTVDFTLNNYWFKDNPATPWSFFTFIPTNQPNRVLNTPPIVYGANVYASYAVRLAPGAFIGSSGPFYDTSYGYYNTGSLDYSYNNGATHNGPWAGAGDGYAGLKFDIGGQTHYGWVRLNVDNYDNGFAITIKDYAYESTPDTAIFAGDIPEPSALGLMALGAAGLLAHRKARKTA